MNNSRPLDLEELKKKIERTSHEILELSEINIPEADGAIPRRIGLAIQEASIQLDIAAVLIEAELDRQWGDRPPGSAS